VFSGTEVDVVDGWVVGAVVEVVVESLFGTTGGDGVIAGFAVHIA
jgi:hypothetical protein